jgi:hypothetical protein
LSRADARRSVERAWEALNPGGILIIQENIKHPSYKRDYELMFEPEELDKLLQGFGEIGYYMSTATKAVQAALVERKTVYRIVHKL